MEDPTPKLDPQEMPDENASEETAQEAAERQSRADIKETRRVLRLVQDHIATAHLKVGAQQEAHGLVEVVSHPTSELATLNYVTPRKNTAWIPAPEIQKGLEHLRKLNRVARVTYVEGLFPPIFSKSLMQLGLVVEFETPIMVYDLREFDATKNTASGKSTGVSVRAVSDQDGIGMWWYVWRNAYYDVLTGNIEPIKIGHEMAQIVSGDQIDLLLYRGDLPVGAARVTVHNTTAHLTTLAIMKEVRTPALIRALYDATLNTAAERGCELLFTSGDTESDRHLGREIGFIDSGSVVCYSEPKLGLQQDKNDGNLAQPVFALP
ncbi:MAG: hypothetical protein RLP44_07805 [Aggregatilineales bacterium]